MRSIDSYRSELAQTEAEQQFVTDGLEAKIAELEQEKQQQIEWTKNNVPPEKAQQRIWYYEITMINKLVN